MESTVVVAILSLVGTLGGSIIAGIVSNNKTLYRIEQLERKVEKHNSVVERVAIAENTLKSQQHQIDELKGICKMINWKVRMRNPMFWGTDIAVCNYADTGISRTYSRGFKLVVGIGGSTYKGGFKPVHFEPCNCQCI